MSDTRTTIRLRRGTAAEWSASAPQPDGEILKLGEPGYETDTKKLKIGDGVTGWNNLPYITGNGISSIVDFEGVEDLLGSSGFLVGGSGITLVYDDENNKLTINGVSAEDINNAFNTTLVAGSGISFNHNPINNTLTINSVPSFLEFDDLSSLPTFGETSKIYITLNNNKTYRWSGSNYVEISPSPGSTDSVVEGSTNLYFTNERASAAAPVKSVNGQIGDVILEVGSAKNSVYSLGSVSGSNAINYAADRNIQTMTLTGAAVQLTKGTGWPTLPTDSVDIVLKITVSSATTITWTIVDQFYNRAPAGALSVGTHLYLLRAMGAIIESHYIGSQT